MVEHALAQLQHRWSERFSDVRAIGAQVEHIDILQVRTFGEARVLQRHLQVGVSIARPQPARYVPERDALHVLVLAEGILAGIVELVVVVRTDVVEEAQGTVVVLDIVVVGTNGMQVLNGMTTLFLHVLVAVLVRECVFHAKLSEVGLFFHVLILEEALVLTPHLVVLKVLTALLGNDNPELQRIEAGKDVAAADHEVLGTHGAATVVVGQQAQVECLQGITTHKCRVGDVYEVGRHVVAGAGAVVVEAHCL